MKNGLLEGGYESVVEIQQNEAREIAMDVLKELQRIYSKREAIEKYNLLRDECKKIVEKLGKRIEDYGAWGIFIGTTYEENKGFDLPDKDDFSIVRFFETKLEELKKEASLEKAK